MTTSERRLKIYNMLLEKEIVDVSELSQYFDVSPMTIRRDLAVYERQGILTTTYGGAYLNRDIASAVDFSAPSDIDDGMRKIGLTAAHLLKNGDNVFIDAGRTTLGIVYGIRNLRLRVVTNSLIAANILRTFSKIELMMLPGAYNEGLSGFLSSSTISHVRKFSFDAALLSGCCLNASFGFTTENETDAHLKATAIDCAKKSIALVHGGDIDRAAFAQVASLRKLDHTVTDKSAPESVVSELEKRGCHILYGE